MIYVVTGFMRTGTSMMMKALGAGGLEIAYDPKIEELNKKYGKKDYRPNPEGFHEVSTYELERFDAPKQFEGKLIKISYGTWLLKMAVADYKIVFMMRHPSEIHQSFVETFESAPPLLLTVGYPTYEMKMQHYIELLKNRKDCDVVVFQYNKVVDNPKRHFQILKDCGWPIDVEKATTVINPKLYRHRIKTN